MVEDMTYKVRQSGEAIFINLIGTSDDVDSERFFSSVSISPGVVGARKMLFAVGSGMNCEKCCPRSCISSLNFSPIVVKKLLNLSATCC